MVPQADPSPSDVTRILQAAASGDERAVEALFPVVYEELRALAGGHMRRERAGHTLQPTALVHEAYLKLITPDAGRWENRTHFFAVASKAMRRILVNHAKTRGRAKRGGGMMRVELDTDDAVVDSPDIDLIALDEALDRLASIDEQKSRVVELRFFGGLTVDEAAKVLGVSERTVRRDWTFAKAWLRGELRRGESEAT